MKSQTNRTISEIIEMAWCDKTSFDDIKTITGLPEPDIIKIMRENLKASSFRLWRKRVSGRKTKHHKKHIFQSALHETIGDDFL